MKQVKKLVLCATLLAVPFGLGNASPDGSSFWFGIALFSALPFGIVVFIPADDLFPLRYVAAFLGQQSLKMARGLASGLRIFVQFCFVWERYCSWRSSCTG